MPRLLGLAFIVSAGVGVFEVGLALRGKQELGLPRILIIGAYRMGFEIAPAGAHSELRVFIDYNLPTESMGRILGWVFAPLYARWCVNSMVRDARRMFR